METENTSMVEEDDRSKLKHGMVKDTAIDKDFPALESSVSQDSPQKEESGESKALPETELSKSSEEGQDQVPTKQGTENALLQEEMLAFYGEDENAYSSDLEKQTATPPRAEEHESSVDEMSSEETPQDSSAGNGMATCEFCGNVGERDTFFSRTKRFCKMECAKKYSASNIRKRMRGDSGSSYKKRQKANAKKVKLKQVKVKETPVVKEEENWQNKSFSWDEYLKQTGSVSAPASLFKHVQITSCLKDLHIGMKVEVINNPCKSSDDVDVAFWVATVMQINQFKVLLRYEGYDESSNADFWFDLRSKDIHPVGWCASQNKLLIPPLGIQNKMSNWRDFLFQKLSGARTFSQAFLQRIQNEPCNKFEVGMKLEVADRKNLYSMCVATVVDIVGDRLRLRYDGLDLDVADDYWCHYLSSEIHPIGWSSLVGHTLQPPIGWKHSLTKWNEFLANDLANSKDAPQSIFVQDSTGTAPGPEQFKVGMKFESFDPLNPSHTVVVTVIKVLKFNYFVLGIDSLATYFCCHANSRNIFPVGWSKRHGISLIPPRDYTPENFDWDDYLSKTGAQIAPPSLFKDDKRANAFKVGMKLEAVDLREPALICPATVVETKGPILRIHFDGWDTGYDQYLDMDSLDIFPVGWCESVGHPLQPPGALEDDPAAFPANLGQSALMLHHLGVLNKMLPSRRPARDTTIPAGKLPPKEQIHFNKKCYCGPYLDKDIVLKLPENIKGVLSGSEKDSLMRRCLQELVQTAYNPKQVMELFSREFYQTKKNRDLDLKSDVCIEIESKNSKRILRRVRVASRSEHVKPYLERVCQVLSCCPHFISQTRFLLGYCSKTCLEKALEDSQSGGTCKFNEAGSSTDAIAGPTTSNQVPLTPDTEMCLPSSSREYKVEPMEDVVNSSVFTYDRTFNNGKNPRLWSSEEVCNFVSLIGCSSYSDNFMKEDVDGQALLLLTKEMLKTLTENRLGPIAKIENAIADLKQQWDI